MEEIAFHGQRNCFYCFCPWGLNWITQSSFHALCSVCGPWRCCREEASFTWFPLKEKSKLASQSDWSQVLEPWRWFKKTREARLNLASNQTLPALHWCRASEPTLSLQLASHRMSGDRTSNFSWKMTFLSFLLRSNWNTNRSVGEVGPTQGRAPSKALLFGERNYARGDRRLSR